MSFTKAQIDEMNEKRRVEALAFAAMTPEERTRRMQSKASKASSKFSLLSPKPRDDQFRVATYDESRKEFTVPVKEKPLRKPRAMNGTETRYSLILDEMKRRGEISRWVYEGIKLKWGDGMYYTGDFWVVRNTDESKRLIIEVKGAHIWEKDKIRFLGCRSEWSHEYDFELHQWAKNRWLQLY